MTTEDATQAQRRTPAGLTDEDLEHARRLARAAAGPLTPEQIAVMRRLFGNAAGRRTQPVAEQQLRDDVA